MGDQSLAPFGGSRQKEEEEEEAYPRESGRLFCRQSEPVCVCVRKHANKQKRREKKKHIIKRVGSIFINYHPSPAFVHIIGSVDNLMSGPNAGYGKHLDNKERDEFKENVKRISFLKLCLWPRENARPRLTHTALAPS